MARRGPSAVQGMLLAALAVLLVLVWRGRADRSGDEGEGTWQRPFDETRIEGVEFISARQRVRVVREEDGFWLDQPYRDRADDRFLAQSLRVAATLEPLRILPDTAGMLFGLEPPAAIWRCWWDGGRYEIALGDTLPAGGGRFARTSRAPEVLVVDPFLARRFLAPPEREIHAPVAAPFEIGRIDSVRIVTREEEIVLVRRPTGFWQIVSPWTVDAASSQVDRGVLALRRESLSAFLGPTDSLDLPSLGLDPPRATWTLIQGRRRETVRIGHPTPDERSAHLIPAGREVVAQIGSESFRVWVDGMKRLRETLLVRTSADSVAAVEIEGPGGRRRFFRRPDGPWIEETPAGTLAIRSEAFATDLGNLCLARAEGFLAAGERRFDPLIELRLIAETGSTEVIQLAKDQRDLALARTPRQPGLSRVAARWLVTWQRWLDDPLRP